VKGIQLGECSQPEVLEISVSEGDAHYRPQGAIETLDKPIGNSFNEVVEDFLPPIAECADKLGQVLVTGQPCFQNPVGPPAFGLFERRALAM
jgi:hypothetical protein